MGFEFRVGESHGKENENKTKTAFIQEFIRIGMEREGLFSLRGKFGSVCYAIGAQGLRRHILDNCSCFYSLPQ